MSETQQPRPCPTLRETLPGDVHRPGDAAKNPSDIAVGSAPLGVAVTPDGRTVFVTNQFSGTVSTIDVKTGAKDPTDIPVGPTPQGVVVTPDGKTAYVADYVSNTVSTIDVRSRTKQPADVAVGMGPSALAVMPCRR